MSFFDRFFGRNKARPKSASPRSQEKATFRAVPGALSYSQDGTVVYNLLDSIMGQFLGRCIGAIKKAGIKAKGTGQFSISLGDGKAELPLDTFYEEVCVDGADPASVIQKVVSAAQSALNKTK